MKQYEKQSKIRDSIERIPEIRYRLVLEGIVVGVMTGGVVSLFRMALIKAESLRDSVLQLAGTSEQWAMASVILIGLLCLGTWICVRVEPMCSGSGIPQVKGELVGRMFQRWWRVILTKIAGGVMAIGAGLSLGREGPSIQLGAMVGKGFSEFTDKLATEEKLLISCGAGAGLSCAFSAPLAGVVFTMEELHRNFSTDILLATMASSIASDFVAYYIFGLTPVFDLTLGNVLPLHQYWHIVVLGVCLGLLGMIYNRFTVCCQNIYEKIPSRSLRLVIPFGLVIVLAVNYPAVLGSGYRLVSETASGEFLIGTLALLLVMKFCFSVISFASGAPGGIFLPMLVIGGVTGGLFAMVAGQMADLPAEYLPIFVTLGMVGFFSAIVRSPVTGVILITEMVGDFSNFLPLCFVALVSYITADLLGSTPIYDMLLERQLSKEMDYGMTHSLRRHKVLIESDVYVGCLMDGEAIKSMLLPEGCLVISVDRMNEEVVPNGNTVLRGGDRLTILCREGDMEVVNVKLDAICRKVTLR